MNDDETISQLRRKSSGNTAVYIIPNFLGSEFLLYTLVKPILGTFSQKLQCDQLFDQMSSLCKSILLENYDIS